MVFLVIAVGSVVHRWYSLVLLLLLDCLLLVSDCVLMFCCCRPCCWDFVLSYSFVGYCCSFDCCSASTITQTINT